MMGEAIQQGGDGSSIGEDSVPFFKCFVGGNHDGTTLVTAADKFIEEVGGIGGIGEIGECVDTEQFGAGVALLKGREGAWGGATQMGEGGGGGAQTDGVGGS